MLVRAFKLYAVVLNLIFVGQPPSLAVLFEYLLNASVLNLDWLIVGNLFHDAFLDALEFGAGDFLLVCKSLNDLGSPDEVCRIVVIRGHGQYFLVVV